MPWYYLSFIHEFKKNQTFLLLRLRGSLFNGRFVFWKKKNTESTMAAHYVTSHFENDAGERAWRLCIASGSSVDRPYISVVFSPAKKPRKRPSLWSVPNMNISWIGTNFPFFIVLLTVQGGKHSFCSNYKLEVF